MFRQLKNDKSGVVLIMVIMAIIVMSLLAVSTVSINVTEVQRLESLSDSIIAEELATMYYWRAYYNTLTLNSYIENIDGQAYTIDITRIPDPLGYDNVLINVSY